MTTKQRAALRAMANTMEPVLQIGKDGITDNLAKQAWDALEARELVKATVQKIINKIDFERERKGAGAKREVKDHFLFLGICI